MLTEALKSVLTNYQPRENEKDLCAWMVENFDVLTNNEQVPLGQILEKYEPETEAEKLLLEALRRLNLELKPEPEIITPRIETYKSRTNLSARNKELEALAVACITSPDNATVTLAQVEQACGSRHTATRVMKLYRDQGKLILTDKRGNYAKLFLSERGE